MIWQKESIQSVDQTYRFCAPFFTKYLRYYSHCRSSIYKLTNNNMKWCLALVAVVAFCAVASGQEDACYQDAQHGCKHNDGESRNIIAPSVFFPQIIFKKTSLTKFHKTCQLICEYILAVLLCMTNS